MAETTSHERELSREETAAYLRRIADELASDETTVRVPVGNKAVRLSPPSRLDTAVRVTERSRRIRRNVEQLELSIEWNPTKRGGGVDEE
ncbi:amphi-Trp domain-containing protein [Halobaculum lipolyticum]|uniref:Amphi-Trp domain-containing protein n=1 Tax=Halobaculum lipolyticum TaxID=3032001 RepID=A0ABD5WFS1_9EURY|nr:amphi-Trp domain-containing protein [Halobaculum sp. DT31]